MLTSWFPIVMVALHAFVGMKRSTTVIVMNCHTTLTTSTHHQAGKQSCSPARRPHRISTRTIGLETRLIALIVLGSDGGWATIGEMDQPMLLRHHHAASTRSLWLLATGIFLSSAIDVSSSIERMFEHHL